MAEENDEQNPLSTGSLLGDLPRTSPEDLKLMENERLSQKHYAAIGKVASEWAYLELVVDGYSAQLAKVEESFGTCLTAQISGIARKLEAHIALVRLRSGEFFAKRLNKFAVKARELSERRNRIVHDPWSIDENGFPHRYEASARKIHKQQMVYVSTSQVLLLYRDIEIAIDEFIALNKEILAHVEPSP